MPRTIGVTKVGGVLKSPHQLKNLRAAFPELLKGGKQ